MLYLSFLFARLTRGGFKVTNIERALISSSLTATMAYMASEGLSALTQDQIAMIRSWQDMYALYCKWQAPSITKQTERLIEVRWEDECELMARLTGPTIDFDPFSISEEDAVNSMLRRGVGDSQFGYEFTHFEDDSDWFIDEFHRYHGFGCNRMFSCDGVECWD